MELFMKLVIAPCYYLQKFVESLPLMGMLLLLLLLCSDGGQAT
jgi:hypothetical protein